MVKKEEKVVLVDTTVQEKAITYPTDSKMAIRIINQLNKIAKNNYVKQRRTYVKRLKELRLDCRNFRHPKKRKSAQRALRELRKIGFILMRELERTLSKSVLDQYQKTFELYTRCLNQSKTDKNKIYSLHEPDIYCIAKGKESKAYEYGRKASIVTTLKSQIIIGVASHDVNIHDSKTLVDAIASAHSVRTTPIQTISADRGYIGGQQYVQAELITPKKPLKRDSELEKNRKRKLCKKRSAIEPIIGHLKHDFRLVRNWLKGSIGDKINLLMAACAWNLRKWLVAIFYVLKFDLLIINFVNHISSELQKATFELA